MGAVSGIAAFILRAVTSHENSSGTIHVEKLLHKTPALKMRLALEALFFLFINALADLFSLSVLICGISLKWQRLLSWRT